MRAENRPHLHLLLAAPRGFCAGVRRAISAVEDALARYGRPVFVRRAIVHNLAVVRALEEKGAIFVEELDEVPDGAVVIFSAHGVPQTVTAEAESRGLTFYDAVCPLVEKVHREVLRHRATDRHVILIGHEGHPEITGTMSRLDPGRVSLIASGDEAEALQLPTETAVAYAVQTTFSVEEASGAISVLRRKFPDLAEPASSDICYATTNRQAAIRLLSRSVDAVIVVGELFSSNACRLAEVARAEGCRNVQLVPDVAQLDWELLPPGGRVAITAAASTPETSVTDLIEALRGRFILSLEESGEAEDLTVFKPLRIAAR